MAAYAWDVPGYVQGHRFSQDRRFFDSAAGRFIDRAGYDHFDNGCSVVVGSPAFSVHGTRSREGLLLDRSCQLRFRPAIPWEGSMLFVFKPTAVSTAYTHYYWLWATAATEASNGRCQLARGSGVNSFVVATPSSALSRSVSGFASGSIVIIAYSTSQQTRTAFSTQDGVTVTESPPATAAINGNSPSMLPGQYVRLGDTIGDGTTTPNATDYIHLFEQHFWKGNVLTGAALPQLAAFIASLKSYYGLTS